MRIKEIPIICRHTLARSSRKISARSVHRELSNQPRPRSTRVKDGENRQFLGNMWNINFIFSHDFWGCQVHQTSSIIHQKKPETLGYQQVKVYQDWSTWAREKGGVKITTDFESPCRSQMWSGSPDTHRVRDLISSSRDSWDTISRRSLRATT